MIVQKDLNKHTIAWYLIPKLLRLARKIYNKRVNGMERVIVKGCNAHNNMTLPSIRWKGYS